MTKRKLVVAVVIAASMAAILIWLIAKWTGSATNPAVTPARRGPPTLSSPETSTPMTTSGTMPTATDHVKSSTTSSLQLPVLPSDWKTLRVEEYKFLFSYPTNGWNLMDVENPTSSSPHQPLYVAKFYSDRTAQDDDAYLVVAVYKKNPASSLTQWTSEQVPDFQKIPEGDIYQALAKAYGEGNDIYARASTPGYSPPADELVTHEEGEENETMRAELGAIVSGGGRLAYITWLARAGSSYVYAVELRLEYAEAEATPPTDRQVIEIYKQMVSSVIFTD